MGLTSRTGVSGPAQGSISSVLSGLSLIYLLFKQKVLHCVSVHGDNVILTYVHEAGEEYAADKSKEEPDPIL